MTTAAAPSPAAAPAAAPTSAPSTGANPVSSGSPVSSGAPASGAAPTAAGIAAKQASGQALTAKEQRYLYKRTREDGTAEDVDISDWKTKVKIAEKEHEVGLKQLVDGYGLKAHSLKKFEEAAALRKAVDGDKAKIQRAAEMLRDPERVMAHLEEIVGERFYDLLSERLAKRVEYERLPPKERQRLDQMTQQQKELARERAELERWKAERQRAEMETKRTRGTEVLQRWEAEAPAAFAELGVRGEKAIKTAHEWSLDVLKRAHKAGMRMTIGEARAEAAERMRDAIGSTVTGLDPNDLRAMVGDQALSRFSQAQQAALQAQPGRQAPPPEAQPTQPREERVLRPDDFRYGRV